MMTSWNGNAFRTTDRFSSQRANNAEHSCRFVVSLYLSFEMPCRSCDITVMITQIIGNKTYLMLSHGYYMMTSSDRKSKSALLAFCEGNSPVTGEFPSQRPVTRILDVFFDPILSKRFSKPSRRWWFETPLHSLWSICNDIQVFIAVSEFVQVCLLA